MDKDLTILPIQPEENEMKNRKVLHPNLPDIYKGQLIVCAAPIRSGKSVLWNNCLMNPNFYADCFQNVDIISNTIFNDSSSRFAANKWKNTCHEMYSDDVITNIVKRQREIKKSDGDSSFCLILDDICGDLNKHGRKGGKAIHFATRFRHAVNKGDPVMMFYANQKYNDVATIIRNNMTGLFLSGNIKSQKEIQTIKDDIQDTFGGSAKFDEFLEKAKQKPYSWLYFRLDSTPPEVYLDFKERLF
mgnify:CR=1 FL=1|tara:strand:- start:4259 stop:4993 length:735 start_codon:yes stop_codon:yes gene_type:complete